MKPHRLMATLFFAVLVAPLAAQEDDPSRLTLDKVFGSGGFYARGSGSPRWTGEGAAYFKLERSKETPGGRDIVRYEAPGEKREVLVPAASLIPEGREKPLSISGYSFSDDGRKLIVFTNTKRVWRARTRGDYWVLDLDSWKLKQVGADKEPSTLMFAKLDPAGTRVGYVCKNDLYVEDLETGATVRLTDDGSPTVSNGTFDWVYEEELRLRDGFRWSPDGKWIAFWRIDATDVGIFNLIDNTSDLYPILKPIRYPKAGTTNPIGRAGVVSADGGETRWFDVPGDRRDHYIARMEWAESSDEVVMQQLNRLQNTNKVMLVRRDTGEARTVLTDEGEAWVEICNDLVWLDGGKTFTWLSERDGWRHVYLVSRSGDDIRCITPGDYDVIDVLRIDEDGGWIYFIASPDNPTQRYLYRVPLTGKGKLERITPKGSDGTHRYNISPDAKYAYHTVSSFGVPPVTELVRLPSHKTVRTVVDNEALREKLGALKRGKEFLFRIDIGDGVELDGWCIQPPDLDPRKRYPVLFHVYGEPAGQTVNDRWGGRTYLWHLMLAQQGYVIMSVDNRGTPAPRGRDWRKSIYLKVGLLSSQDQAAAAEAIAKKWPWVDLERIGIWGWSGGGSMSMNMIFRYPKIYKTAMAIASVPDQRLYDTIYMERYMGLPQDNPDAYAQGSPITFAHQLEGNLLVVHGTADDNCHYQGPELLFDELIKHGKHFTMMAYPGRSHSIYEKPGTSRHLWELLTRYLTENLPAGPR